MTEVVTDVANSNPRALWTPGRVRWTGRDDTNPGDCNITVRSPRGNSPVLIGGIGVLPTIGHSGSLEFLNKWQSTSPSVSRNTQNLDTSVDGNLADEGDSTSIFSKVLG